MYVFEDNFLRYIDLIVGYFKPYPVVGDHMENQTLPSRPQQIGFQVFLETSNPIDVFASDSGWMTGYGEVIQANPTHYFRFADHPETARKAAC